MRTVTDSSALARLYLSEPGADALDAVLAETAELGLCVLCLPEVVSALRRHRREGRIAQHGYRRAIEQLTADVRDAVTLQLTSAVIAAAVRLLEAGPLRASDALHAACAIEWQADLFVTGDRRQAAAAAQAGLMVRVLGASL